MIIIVYINNKINLIFVRYTGDEEKKTGGEEGEADAAVDAGAAKA